MVVLGDVMADVVCLLSGPLAVGSDTRAVVEHRPGGSAANTAAWLGWLGTPATLVGRVGDDTAGRAAHDALVAAGVRTALTVDPDRPTGTCVVLVGPDGERSMLPSPGANAALTADDLPDWPAGSGWLHLSGYPLLSESARPAALAAIGSARAGGLRVSVDPASADPLRAAGPRAFLDAVAGVDLLLPNADEARVLTGQDDLHRAALELAAYAATVVITCGAAGALLARAGAPVLAVPAGAVPVLDSTGAGDAFAAGLLHGLLLGADDRAALLGAHAVAAVAVGRVGGRPPG